MHRTNLGLILAAALILPAFQAAGAQDEEETSETDTLSHVVPLPEVVVSTSRAGDRAPIAKSVLSRSEIVRENWGQDTPMLFSTLPGTYAYSDAGNGIGYSYLSIRGFPQRRISVLIDGVPLNDPESHEVYWIDHPDLLASTAEAQLQRGVGAALYGAASVGGSVNLETSPFTEQRRAAATLAYGSYETKRLMVEMNSGRLPQDWDFYGRYSRIESQGYRDQSWSKLWSYYFSARKLIGDHSVRANLYGGPEETHLAYLGVPADYLEGLITGDRDRDRRYNPIIYKNERDHFFEPHYELIHTWAPRAGLTLSQTLFFFDGKGFYDELRFGESLAAYRLSPWLTYDPTLFGADSLAYYQDANDDGVLDRDSQGRVTVENFDVVRRRTIANRHYGWIPRVRFEHPGGAIILGGELRAHDGRHWGEVLSGNGLPPGTQPTTSNPETFKYYDYHPRTLSGGVFMREEWSPVGGLMVTGDMAWRHQAYRMRGDQFDGIRFDQDYDFALPRVGLTYAPMPRMTAFASWSYSKREPSFRSLYDGESGLPPLYRKLDIAAGIYEDPYIKPEKVNDYEVGATWSPPGLSLSANLFFMDFRDELVDYQFNPDLGNYVTANAAKSVHQGVELTARGERRLAGSLGLALNANATLSDNHFVTYDEVIDSALTIRHEDTAIALFPSLLANIGGTAQWRGFVAGAELRHVGRIYVDPNENLLASVGPHTVLNLSGGYQLPWGGGSEASLVVRVFNVLDERYATSGYMNYDFATNSLYPVFIPAATRNALAEVRVVF